eukprot:SAG31_NODE_2386_length_5814_cov_3.981627_4_plen_133_part_00
MSSRVFGSVTVNEDGSKKVNLNDGSRDTDRRTVMHNYVILKPDGSYFSGFESETDGEDWGPDYVNQYVEEGTYTVEDEKIFLTKLKSASGDGSKCLTSLLTDPNCVNEPAPNEATEPKSRELHGITPQMLGL